MYGKKVIDYDIIAVDPLPTSGDLEEYYSKLYYQTADGHKNTYDAVYTQEELDHKVLEAKIAIESIKQSTPKTMLSLVELGCGEGFFLNEASLCRWDAKGTDFSAFGIEKWHPHLKSVFKEGDSYDYIKDTISQNMFFDVCVLRNVLEHVIDPKDLLLSIKKILADDGKILITVPNDYSLLQKRAMELGHIDKEFWFAPPDHLYYFNTKNIIPFVEDCGFEVCDMYSSFPVDFFLFHSGSNYIANKSNGKSAHFARVNIDLLMAESGVNSVLDLYRSLARCGVGRDLTVLLKMKS